MAKKVVVLGASGMVGSMLVDHLTRDDSLSVIASVRCQQLAERGRARLDSVEWRLLDAESCTQRAVREAIGDAEWVVNAIGMTKPYIHDNNPTEVERAIKVNALFPHVLAAAAEEEGARVLQIATDCVYSGQRGRYSELDKHDALDVYGKTKSLGEPSRANVHCLRSSIVGPEPKAYVFLLEWFRGQPRHAKLCGYTDCLWNGVTSLHLARLCHGIIIHGIALPHLHHVVPAGEVTKAELLRCFARSYSREDIVITPCEAEVPSNRTLATIDETLNRQVWAAAGYTELPTIAEMIQEMSEFR